MITLYILKSTHNNKRYIGITNNIDRRIQDHKAKHSKGSQILGELTLIHTEAYKDYSSARIREKFLKSGKGREWMNTNLPSNPPSADKAG
jgi:putative endonuclease